MGDFNAILPPTDKKSPYTIVKRCEFFGNFVDSCNLQDLGYIGPSFTWQRGGTLVRLDRALVNDAWMATFPQSIVHDLTRIKSDHRPLLLITKPDIINFEGRPFRFLAGWTLHNNFSNLVKGKWEFKGNMTDSLNKFIASVKDWNRDVYGFLGNRKRKLMRALNNIQKTLEISTSNHLIRKEREMRDELENVLDHKDLLWRQKARCDWLQLGDRNTNFFHSRTIKRRKSNRIMSLRIENGDWCSDQSILKNKAVEFFGKLYDEDQTSSRDNLKKDFARLKTSEIRSLETPISNEEIKKSLFDMAPLKAPGSDGYHAIFFQSQWDILGNDICQWVKCVFDGRPIEPELNNTLIVLVPKKESPEDFSQFRPISLCTVLYKLVMKVIANRFKVIFPKMISQEQASFIAGRSIFDNIILAQEVIHSMRSNRKGRKWMAIKLDLEKAYDRVSWDYINASLTAVGIPLFLRNVIMSAISSFTMQVLWNGVPTQKFKPKLGLRQGCPLSPYLFILCMEWLGLFIHSKIEAGTWEPTRLSRSGPPISHMFFADDLVIFCKAQMDQARLLKSILYLFCDISGHKISGRKSNIFFSKNTKADIRNQISQLLGFQEVQNLGMYLGVPLLHDRVTKSTLNFVVDKIRRKLNSWDARKLSFAGRITLAQSILLSIPNYFMQTLMIPQGVCDDIERLARQFICGSTEKKSKMALVGWDTICQPRACGGLGLRQLKDQNSSFFMKIGFSLVSKSDMLWVRALRSKYGWKSQLPETISRNQCSHLWRSLSKLWPIIRENLIWSVGDGANVWCWKDPWIPGMGPLISKIPSFSNLNLDCCVKEMVNIDGSWNLDLFRVWLSEEVINRITSIPPPPGCWSRQSDMGPLSNRNFFSSQCLLVIEREYVAPSRRMLEATMEVQGTERLTLNLGFHESLQGNGLTWSSLFGMIAWRIWKNRNLLIFQNISWQATEVVKVSSCWARQYESSRAFHKNNLQNSNSNNITNDNWVFLSTDGAVNNHTGVAAAGGVARDHEGNWITGFNHFLGVCTPMEAVIWGIMDGILILLNKGFRRITIASDNLEVVQNLLALNTEDSGIALLRRTKRIIQSAGEWNIKYVPRNRNMVADCLAKLSLNWKSNLQVFEEAPKEILDLLQVDKANGYFL
ncbi:RNA-directed DNA polymerase (Reverse transcriptase) [Gossypium australe]|uniref:RNA-directed DNA polymerase (Reverse transcriptase) n=1 Tax=Gossypium australe TaxID=47621 RepID=A0A5B6WLI0_9ROSI|nr:RNA-directed DNA polymerase (Reverse transcriptase) [Gossypium australe]